MKLKQLAAAVLLSGAVSLTVSADLANDVKNQGAEAVIADAMRQGQSLETIMASLSTALKDSPLLLSQVVQQAVQSFPQQAATIVIGSWYLTPLPRLHKSLLPRYRQYLNRLL